MSILHSIKKRINRDKNHDIWILFVKQNKKVSKQLKKFDLILLFDFLNSKSFTFDQFLKFELQKKPNFNSIQELLRLLYVNKDVKYKEL